MDSHSDLTIWQKIVQRRSFTQHCIDRLLLLRDLPTDVYDTLRSLVTRDIQDGFSRNLMDNLVIEQKELYGQRIPSKIWNLIEEDRLVTWQEAATITQEVVIDLAQDKQWNVELQTNKRIFSVDRLNKIVYVPRKDLHSRKFVAVLFHELVVHVLRYVQHQIVLPGYRTFEEGLASSLQMYILGEPMILYGRNKVRDFLLLLWEQGVSAGSVHNVFETLLAQQIIPHHPYSWQKIFFRTLETQQGVTQLKRRYKIYSLGTHRFGRFLKRYNSKKVRTRKIAHKISTILLQAKFDPMSKQHLQELKRLKMLDISEEEIQYFLSGKYTV